MNPALEVRKLAFAFGKAPVLREVSLVVPSGGFFIIIGPNGSGKTTLLKIVAGILRPDAGQVDVLGRPLAAFSRRALARAIAFVPQAVAGELPFSVFEFVLLGRSPHLGLLALEGETDVDLARRAITFTGVAHLADRRLDQLSGGERQRVFIARAICQEPRILLLDEPTASLDLAHQMRVMDLMERLRQEKDLTIVMVSHDINLAGQYGDRLLLIKEGRAIRQGRPEEVLNFRTLEEAYGCVLLVDQSPLGQVPRVTPVPEKYMPTHLD